MFSKLILLGVISVNPTLPPSSIDRLTPSAKKAIVTIAQKTKCNIVITSGYRSIPHNRRVGGSPRSYHITGRAIDFFSTNCKRIELYRKIKALKLDLEELITYKKRGHTHIAVK